MTATLYAFGEVALRILIVGVCLAVLVGVGRLRR